jgi:hypothetical protein
MSAPPATRQIVNFIEEFARVARVARTATDAAPTAASEARIGGARTGPRTRLQDDQVATDRM